LEAALAPKSWAWEQGRELGPESPKFGSGAAPKEPKGSGSPALPITTYYGRRFFLH